MKEDIFERLHYHSGLVAQGCWSDLDDYDREAIQRFGDLVVKECLDICQQAIEQNNQTYTMLKEDELAEKMVIHGSIKQAEKLAQGIKKHFGVEL